MMIFWEINNIFQKSIFQNTSSAQKMQNSIQDFFSKCVQIRSFLRIWSQSLQKSFMENFIFFAVLVHLNLFNYQTRIQNTVKYLR